jgi:hypothetical protein
VPTFSKADVLAIERAVVDRPVALHEALGPLLGAAAELVGDGELREEVLLRLGDL